MIGSAAIGILVMGIVFSQFVKKINKKEKPITKKERTNRVFLIIGYLVLSYMVGVIATTIIQLLTRGG